MAQSPACSDDFILVDVHSKHSTDTSNILPTVDSDEALIDVDPSVEVLSLSSRSSSPSIVGIEDTIPGAGIVNFDALPSGNAQSANTCHPDQMIDTSHPSQSHVPQTLESQTAQSHQSEENGQRQSRTTSLLFDDSSCIISSKCENHGQIDRHIFDLLINDSLQKRIQGANMSTVSRDQLQHLMMARLRQLPQDHTVVKEASKWSPWAEYLSPHRTLSITEMSQLAQNLLDDHQRKILLCLMHSHQDALHSQCLLQSITTDSTQIQSTVPDSGLDVVGESQKLVNQCYESINITQCNHHRWNKDMKSVLVIPGYNFWAGASTETQVAVVSHRLRDSLRMSIFRQSPTNKKQHLAQSMSARKHEPDWNENIATPPCPSITDSLPNTDTMRPKRQASRGDLTELSLPLRPAKRVSLAGQEPLQIQERSVNRIDNRQSTDSDASQPEISQTMEYSPDAGDRPHSGSTTNSNVNISETRSPNARSWPSTDAYNTQMVLLELLNCTMKICHKKSSVVVLKTGKPVARNSVHRDTKTSKTSKTPKPPRGISLSDYQEWLMSCEQRESRRLEEREAGKEYTTTDILYDNSSSFNNASFDPGKLIYPPIMKLRMSSSDIKECLHFKDDTPWLSFTIPTSTPLGEPIDLQSYVIRCDIENALLDKLDSKFLSQHTLRWTKHHSGNPFLSLEQIRYALAFLNPCLHRASPETNFSVKSALLVAAALVRYHLTRELAPILPVIRRNTAGDKWLMFEHKNQQCEIRVYSVRCEVSQPVYDQTKSSSYTVHSSDSLYNYWALLNPNINFSTPGLFQKASESFYTLDKNAYDRLRFANLPVVATIDKTQMTQLPKTNQTQHQSEVRWIQIKMRADQPIMATHGIDVDAIRKGSEGVMTPEYASVLQEMAISDAIIEREARQLRSEPAVKPVSHGRSQMTGVMTSPASGHNSITTGTVTESVRDGYESDTRPPSRTMLSSTESNLLQEDDHHSSQIAYGYIQPSPLQVKLRSEMNDELESAITAERQRRKTEQRQYLRKQKFANQYADIFGSPHPDAEEIVESSSTRYEEKLQAGIHHLSTLPDYKPQMRILELQNAQRLAARKAGIDIKPAMNTTAFSNLMTVSRTHLPHMPTDSQNTKEILEYLEAHSRKRMAMAIAEEKAKTDPYSQEANTSTK